MERRQSSEEEEEDSLSGKGCGPLFQSSREQLEPNHWLPRKYVDMLTFLLSEGSTNPIFIPF